MDKSVERGSEMKDGFIKCAAGAFGVEVADCEHNADEVVRLIEEADKEGVKVLVLPELCITGYTCHDLFYQPVLIDGAKSALQRVLKATEGRDMLTAAGCPLEFFGKLYNCAVIMFRGKILGIVPKKFLPNYSEYYEQRQFTSSPDGNCEVEIFGSSVPFGQGLVFDCGYFSFGAELCEDLWSPLPPSTSLALGGALIIGNLSASNEIIGKKEYRLELVKTQSARLLCGYIYTSSGEGESTQDLVFSGHRIISEDGEVLTESALYTTGLTITEIDVKRLAYERRHNTSFVCEQKNIRRVIFSLESVMETTLTRYIDPSPFVPKSASEKDKRCADILAMQAHGLAKRIRHTHSKCVVVGISGGLDSCLALLVCVEAMQILKRPNSDIIAVTMPCFGTTAHTKSNAEKVCNILNTTLRIIDISETVKKHLSDIGHDENTFDVTYENAQARERTKVLMDIANSENGMVIGTGDLSELALGWATYNGDHMSMYGVNISVPKTLVRHIVHYYAQNSKNSELSEVLTAIFNTPVSPELLPAKDGEISQKTEDIVGPYELHDFFLYYGIRRGYAPKKVFRLAEYCLGKNYDRATIFKWLEVFYRRFFAQQFKRSCLPDGVKVGSVTLSPRGDWRMPSDASAKLWLDEINEIMQDS